MVRAIHRLTAMAAKTKKPGMYPDGGGLYLQITNAAAKSWIFRFKMPGTKGERYMGLGSAGTVSLERAREDARRYREMIFDGKDPIKEREDDRQRKAAEVAKAMTFEQCADAYIRAHEPTWKNPKHRQQWRSTLKTYAYPVLGGLPVAEVDTPLVRKVLDPIWLDKPETASRLRGRIESVLDWATAAEHRRGDNPARWNGHLEQLLPKRGKVRKVRHHPALPYASMGAFWADLCGREGLAALALRFLILTCARTGEAIGAEWREFDLDEKTWTVPEGRMKGEREHTVPLSAEAVKILRHVQKSKQPGARVFPLSNMAMLALLDRMGPYKDDNGEPITVHGFRSTFRDWAAEQTGYPEYVVEKALAHIVADKVEAAYRRGDLMEKRRRLLEDWATFCASPGASTADNVVSLRAAE